MTETPSTETPGRAPVMTDVARRAGVSHQTVSRVLNGHPSIRPETRERVQRAIDDLGYRRNRAARALVTRRTLTIGVVASSTPLFGPSSTLHGVERAAHAAGYATILSTSDTTGRDGVLACVAQLADRGVDGLVLTAPLHEVPDLREHLPADLPTVCATGGPVAGLPSVHVDHRAGARAATDLLVGLGHREVRHVGGSPGWFEAAEREGGWRDALEAAGVAPSPVLTGGWSASEGYAAGLALADDPAATAVVAANDQLALGLLRALGERGVDVPGRVSVAGFDDVPEAGYLSPPLTTVRQDLARVGREAVHLLLARLRDADVPTAECSVVAPRLVVRASTGPAPAPV
ncbi:LacI family DNA-binding transcriptional regulator [uncultured Pseudokineococcus sp.]|uniref:LacI family DNA-binding transcriptional regulator n=1 Tax=uncultured Pseudokineococcus sp. TaxID=1642928 RepID=UPI00262DFCF4|nr:LacI family DNA-binding transcriptional regulator [uncultured Pseudokineococcus sp.]